MISRQARMAARAGCPVLEAGELMVEWVTKCSLCDETRWTPLYSEMVPTRFDERRTERFGLVRCNGCGLVRLSPRPEEAEIGQYYPAAFYSSLSPEGAPQGSSRRRGLAQRLYRRMVPQANRRRLDACLGLVGRTHGSFRGRLLDVGTGEGAFLQEMSRLGWDVQGTDLSPEAARMTSERLDLEVRVGNFETIDFADERFDLVTLWDVLEHIYQPMRALRKIRELLRPDGRVLTSVPNLASLEARLLGRDWPHLDVPRHIHHFTPATLRRALETAGFTVRWTATADVLTDNLLASLLPVFRRRESAGSQPGGPMRQLVGDVGRLAVSPLQSILDHTGLGPALVACAENDVSIQGR